jgi:hypothetical protein
MHSCEPTRTRCQRLGVKGPGLDLSDFTDRPLATTRVAFQGAVRDWLGSLTTVPRWWPNDCVRGRSRASVVDGSRVWTAPMNQDGRPRTPTSRPGSLGVRGSSPPSSTRGAPALGTPSTCACSRRLAEAAEPQPEPQRDLDLYGRSRISPDAAPLVICVNGAQANLHGREKVIWGQGVAGSNPVSPTAGNRSSGAVFGEIRNGP